jgi:hypothetical protein
VFPVPFVHPFSHTEVYDVFSDSIKDDPLPDYAANLLAALRDLDVKSNGFDFMSFVIRSCLPKIQHRLGADVFVFQCPLDDILDGWVPEPGETLAPKQVLLGPAYDILREYLASLVERDRCEWNIKTAPMWITTLCRVIKRTKQLASECYNRSNKTIDSDNLNRLIFALSGLYFLSYHVPILQLLSLPSVKLRLSQNLKSRGEALVIDDGKLARPPHFAPVI